ncbi:MAG: putative toxin-antitoxin system toxin component, PIN family [Verrucomicrobia bacterium]|nr:putative toxin-antitoxin system toxin component, PIN family [Verrucomicrobiota bacterium]
MKPVAVLDSSVVVSGIGWRGGEARAVLRLLARREFVSARTAWLTAEWAETVERVAREESRWQNRNWRSWLAWLNHASVAFEEIPIRPTVRRDPDDDPVVMAAVAARAQFIVAYDPDLLDLEKPYGIACVTPRKFLSSVRRGRGPV